MNASKSSVLPAVTVTEINDKTFTHEIYILDQATYEANGCESLTATFADDCLSPARSLSNIADFSGSSCD